jgi:cytochrome P450
MEAQQAIPEFLKRFPDYAVSDSVEWLPLMMTRGMKSLPIVLGL